MVDWFNTLAKPMENNRILMKPFDHSDKDDLSGIVYDANIWRYFVQQIADERNLDTFLQQAIDDTYNGSRFVYSITSKDEDRVVGSMAFGNIAEADKRIEIGWSWVCKEAQGTGINQCAKSLMLSRAFEVLDCCRVEFKTDILNMQARRGLEKIGATEEGTLRSFNFMPSGRRRDAIYYSILKDEWPAAKQLLDGQMG